MYHKGDGTEDRRSRQRSQYTKDDSSKLQEDHTTEVKYLVLSTLHVIQRIYIQHNAITLLQLYLDTDSILLSSFFLITNVAPDTSLLSLWL